MTIVDKPESATARVKRPSLVFRMFLAGLLSAAVLAWLIPTLVTREIGVAAWLPWTVVLGSVALCAGPEIVRRVRHR
jgi:hypothetical protein